MKKFIELKHRSQKGQALPIVLCLLAIGSLTIGASLNYSTNILNAGRIVKQNVEGIYAADAGIQHTLWALQNGNTTLTQLPEQVNAMTVNISTVIGSGLSTVYINGLASGGHSLGYEMTYNLTPAGNNTYNVTVTLITNNDAKNNAKLEELGTVVPLGYTYVNNSTSVNPIGNITPDNPSSTGYDGQGHQWLKWLWTGSSMPSLPRNQLWTQKFQITGTGYAGGGYSWIVANSEDIGVVGQLTGYLTTINATAMRASDGRVTARTYVQALVGSGGVYVLSWRIAN